MKKIISVNLVFLICLLGMFFLAKEVSATPLSGANANLDSFKYDNGGTFTTATTAANDATTNDFQICGDAINDAAYFGMNYVFDQIKIKYDTACATGTVVWEYYNGTSWASLEGLDGFSDGTGDFKNTAGTYTVTLATSIPADWTKVEVDSVTLYWVRARVDTTAYAADVTGGSQASTREYNLQITVYRMDGSTGITSLTTDAFTVADGTDNTKFAFRETTGGAYQLALMSDAADVDYNVTVAVTGYVDKTIATGALSTTLTEKTVTMEGDYKITVYKMDGSTVFQGVTVTIYTASNYNTIADNLDASGDNDATGTTDSSGIKKFALASGTTYHYKVEYTNYVSEGSTADPKAVGTVTSGSLTTNTETMFTLVLNISVVDPGVGNALNIYWSNPTDTVGFHHIHIYRSTNSGVLGTKILDNWTTPTTYTDRNLVTGRTYYYTLRTVRSDDVESSDTTQYSKAPTGAAGLDVTAPSPPSNVKVVDPTTGGTLNLSWINPPEADFSHIRIYRSTTAGVLGSLVYDNVVGTSKTDTGLTNDLTCYYTLRSVDKWGNESSNTDQYSGTPTLAVVPEEVPPKEEVPPPEEEVVPPVEKPIAEMTVEELKAKIVEVQQKIIELLKQLIEFIQSQIAEFQAKLTP